MASSTPNTVFQTWSSQVDRTNYPTKTTIPSNGKPSLKQPWKAFCGVSGSKDKTPGEGKFVAVSGTNFSIWHLPPRDG
ncbi:hypothetical protein MMC12_005089 [Toensbergia leucococca]|nr:hypothetical protein [Toensbergia leucococca]